MCIWSRLTASNGSLYHDSHADGVPAQIGRTSRHADSGASAISPNARRICHRFQGAEVYCRKGTVCQRQCDSSLDTEYLYRPLKLGFEARSFQLLASPCVACCVRANDQHARIGEPVSTLYAGDLSLSKGRHACFLGVFQNMSSVPTDSYVSGCTEYASACASGREPY